MNSKRKSNVPAKSIYINSGNATRDVQFPASNHRLPTIERLKEVRRLAGSERIHQIHQDATDDLAMQNKTLMEKKSRGYPQQQGPLRSSVMCTGFFGFKSRHERIALFIG